MLYNHLCQIQSKCDIQCHCPLSAADHIKRLCPHALLAASIHLRGLSHNNKYYYSPDTTTTTTHYYNCYNINIHQVMIKCFQSVRCNATPTNSTTRGIQTVLQVDMLDWKTFQYLYTNKMHISPELMWAWSGYDVIVTYNVIKHFISVLSARLLPQTWLIHCLDSSHYGGSFSNLEKDNS